MGDWNPDDPRTLGLQWRPRRVVDTTVATLTEEPIQVLPLSTEAETHPTAEIVLGSAIPQAGVWELEIFEHGDEVAQNVETLICHPNGIPTISNMATQAGSSVLANLLDAVDDLASGGAVDTANYITNPSATNFAWEFEFDMSAVVGKRILGIAVRVVYAGTGTVTVADEQPLTDERDLVTAIANTGAVGTFRDATYDLSQTGGVEAVLVEEVNPETGKPWTNAAALAYDGGNAIEFSGASVAVNGVRLAAIALLVTVCDENRVARGQIIAPSAGANQVSLTTPNGVANWSKAAAVRYSVGLRRLHRSEGSISWRSLDDGEAPAPIGESYLAVLDDVVVTDLGPARTPAFVVTFQTSAGADGVDGQPYSSIEQISVAGASTLEQEFRDADGSTYRRVALQVLDGQTPDDVLLVEIVRRSDAVVMFAVEITQADYEAAVETYGWRRLAKLADVGAVLAASTQYAVRASSPDATIPWVLDLLPHEDDGSASYGSWADTATYDGQTAHDLPFPNMPPAATSPPTGWSNDSNSNLIGFSGGEVEVRSTSGNGTRGGKSSTAALGRRVPVGGSIQASVTWEHAGGAASNACRLGFDFYDSSNVLVTTSWLADVVVTNGGGPLVEAGTVVVPAGAFRAVPRIQVDDVQAGGGGPHASEFEFSTIGDGDWPVLVTTAPTAPASIAVTVAEHELVGYESTRGGRCEIPSIPYAVVTWPETVLDDEFAHYRVWRSDDGGLTYQPIGRITSEVLTRWVDLEHLFAEPGPCYGVTVVRDDDAESELQAGVRGLLLAGAGRARTVETAALDLVDFAVLVDATATDWTPATAQLLGGVWAETGDERSFYVAVNPDGTFQLGVSSDGTAAGVETYDSVDAPIIGAGTRAQLRIEYTADDGDGDTQVRFQITRDGETYDEIGTLSGPGLATAPHPAVASIEIGSFADGAGSGLAAFDGRIHSFEILDEAGPEGSAVASPDFDAQPDATTEFVDDLDLTWQIVGPATIDASAGCATFLAPGSAYVLTSNARPDLTCAFVDTYPAPADRTYQFPDANGVQLVELLDRDGFVAFIPAETRGVTFARPLAIVAAGGDLSRGEIAAFVPLIAISRAPGLDYVCVRQGRDRWLANVRVPDGRVRRSAGHVAAQILVAEVKFAPFEYEVS